MALVLGETLNAVASSSRSNAAASMAPQEKKDGLEVARTEEATPVDALDGGDHRGADDDEAGSSHAQAQGEAVGKNGEGVVGEKEMEKEKEDEPAPPTTLAAPPRSSKRRTASKASTSSRSPPSRAAKDAARRQQALTRPDTAPLAAKHAKSKSNGGSDKEDKEGRVGESAEAESEADEGADTSAATSAEEHLATALATAVAEAKQSNVGNTQASSSTLPASTPAVPFATAASKPFVKSLNLPADSDLAKLDPVKAKPPPDTSDEDNSSSDDSDEAPTPSGSKATSVGLPAPPRLNRRNRRALDRRQMQAFRDAAAISRAAHDGVLVLARLRQKLFEKRTREAIQQCRSDS